MPKFFDKINERHKEFIDQQKMYFVGSAPLSSKGRVNLSPKGLDSFRVINDHEVGYMDLIGSGNETSAHLLENGRITFMFCSYDKVPLILRLYGTGSTVLPGSKDWEHYARHFKIIPSTRQLIIGKIKMVQTSCGYGVPMYEYQSNRTTHFDWADKKGPEGLELYKQEKNTQSIDGLITKLGEQLT